MNDKELQQRLDVLSSGEKLAVVMCANSFRFGGNWAFVKKEHPGYKDILEAIKVEKPNVKLIQVSNGAIVLCAPDFLAFIVNKVIPGAIGGDFFAMAEERRHDERVKFGKFLSSVVEGKSSHIVKKNGFYEVVIGIMSVNDTHAIRIRGHEYPAYKLSLLEVLDFMKLLVSKNYDVYLRAVTPEGVEVYDNAVKLATSGKGVMAVYRGLEIADSDTGVFMVLRLA